MVQITNSVPMAVFGPGSLYITRNDNAGPNTPVNVGYCQEFSYDESAENKELYGQNSYPLVTARGTIKATGKIKAATLSGLALSQAFWGQSFGSGVIRASLANSEAIPGTPYQVTPTVPSSGTFDKDLGCLYVATGLPLIRVAMSPAAGQYAVDETTGVYTFAAADTTLSVYISFAYTVSGTGQKITVQNEPIGTTPSFQIDYVSTLYGQTYYVRFFACVSTKLARAHKLTDFDMPEIDFSFFANASGQVYEMSMDVAA